MEFDFIGLSSREKIVVLLGFLTGLLHLIYGLHGLLAPPLTTMNYLFIANFFGNIFFVTVLYFAPELDRYHEIIKVLFVLFTLSSIIAYIVIYLPGGLGLVLYAPGVFDKSLEIMLIIFLMINHPLDRIHDPQQEGQGYTTA